MSESATSRALLAEIANIVRVKRLSSGFFMCLKITPTGVASPRSEEHTSELQSRQYLVCRLLIEKKKILSKEEGKAPARMEQLILMEQVAPDAHQLHRQKGIIKISAPVNLLTGFFFFNDTATTEIYTLSLHDALPIFLRLRRTGGEGRPRLAPRKAQAKE